MARVRSALRCAHVAILVITVFLVGLCAVALQRAEAGGSPWRDAALILTWGLSLVAVLLVMGAFLFWTLPANSDATFTGAGEALLPAQFLLAMAGAVCWWRATTERSRSRYRRALAWLGAGVLWFVAWGGALALIA